MSKLLLVLTIGFITQWAFSAEWPCAGKYRTGEFEYIGNIDNVRITRTKSKQVEIWNEGKSKIILKIKWLTDSSYVLTHKKSINAPGCLEKGDKIYTTITKCMNDVYTCNYTSENCNSGTISIRKLN